MKQTPGFWFAVAATAIVLAALVAGVLAISGPGEARLERLDEKRRADLRAIEQALQREWREGRAVPETPRALAEADLFGVAALEDPATGEPYGYRALSDSTAEVCATFARAHEPEVGTYRYERMDSEITHHAAGLACFTLASDR